MTAPARDPKARPDRPRSGTRLVVVGVVAVVVSAVVADDDGVSGIVVVGGGVVGGVVVGGVVVGAVVVTCFDDLVHGIRWLRHRVNRRREWIGERRVARMPLRMAELSVWMLPAENRPRYRQEFEEELFELGDQPRRVQLGYAMRLLVRSVALRRALLHSARTAPSQRQDW